MTEENQWWAGLAGFVHADGACGYDWREQANTTGKAERLANSPLDDPAWRSLFAFLVLFLAAPGFGRMVTRLLGVHPLAGAMLLGLLVCTPATGMVSFTLAPRYLGALGSIFRAFVALESAVHIVPLRRLRKDPWMCLASGLIVATLSMVMALCTVPWLMLRYSALFNEPASNVSLPIMSGAYALTTASAIGIVASSAEPSCLAGLFHETGAAGIFTSSALMASSAIFLTSTCLLVLGAPILASAPNTTTYVVLSCTASSLCTLVIAGSLAACFLCLNSVDLQRSVRAFKPSPYFERIAKPLTDVVHINANEILRALKGVITLGISVAVFQLSSALERMEAGGVTPSDILHSCVTTQSSGCLTSNESYASSGATCLVDFKAAGTASEDRSAQIPSRLLPFCHLSFQPWVACFLASLIVCNHPWNLMSSSKVRWQLTLQPWANHMHIALAILSGMLLSTPGVLRVSGAVALTLFVVRIAVMGVVSPVIAVAAGLPLRCIWAAPFRTLVQAQVALCFLLELRDRVLVLSAYPFDFVSVCGVFILLELCVGPPLLRTALRIAGEMQVDRVGHACVLGAEGAPPVITLKLFEWEVHAGAGQGHVADFAWKVRDVETTESLDEASVRRVLLDAKPTVFVSMMEDDLLNFQACQLMLGHFDIPRCIVRCIDPAWQRKYAVLRPTNAVHVVQHLSTSVRNVLNQFVHSSQSAAVLLGDDSSAGVLKVTITEKEHRLRVRDLKVPEDVQVLSIHREIESSGLVSSTTSEQSFRRSHSEELKCGSLFGLTTTMNSDAERSTEISEDYCGSDVSENRSMRAGTVRRVPIIPHGHTELKQNDEVTICGRPDSLALVTGLRKGKIVLQIDIPTPGRFR